MQRGPEARGGPALPGSGTPGPGTRLVDDARGATCGAAQSDGTAALRKGWRRARARVTPSTRTVGPRRIPAPRCASPRAAPSSCGRAPGPAPCASVCARAPRSAPGWRHRGRHRLSGGGRGSYLEGGAAAPPDAQRRGPRGESSAGAGPPEQPADSEVDDPPEGIFWAASPGGIPPEPGSRGAGPSARPGTQGTDRQAVQVQPPPPPSHPPPGDLGLGKVAGT